MNFIHLNDENFNDLIKGKKVLVDFYAEWCGPCKMLGPVIEEVSNEIKDVLFIKVDIDKFELLATQYGIMSVPTLILFENGEIVNKASGFMPKERLINFLK